MLKRLMGRWISNHFTKKTDGILILTMLLFIAISNNESPCTLMQENLILPHNNGSGNRFTN